MIKDTYIRIRLTSVQKKQIKEAAKCDNKSVSEFVLTAVQKFIAKGDK